MDDNNDRVRDREEEEEDDNGRNVRQRGEEGDNQADNRLEPFKAKVSINIAHIVPVASEIAAVQNQQQIDPNSRIVSLEEVQAKGSQMGAVMLVKVLSITAVSQTGQSQVQQRSFNGGRGAPTQVRHQRRVVLLCMNSSPGNGTMMVLIGSGCCANFLNWDVSIRDTGGLCPGSVGLILNPRKSDKYLSETNTVILETQRPFIVTNSNIEMPEISIFSSGTGINGFNLHNCQITVTSVEPYDSPCGGYLCDHQSLKKGGVVANRCPCIQMIRRTGITAIEIEVEVMLPGGGGSFTAVFSSRWFNETFVFTGPLPQNIRVGSFGHYIVENRLFQAITAAVRLINNSGGWQVFGWAKRGEVLDQGVDQPNNGLPHNAPRVMVEAGTLNHHITRLEPMCPERVDLDALNGIKFDVTTGFNI